MKLKQLQPKNQTAPKNEVTVNLKKKNDEWKIVSLISVPAKLQF